MSRFPFAEVQRWGRSFDYWVSRLPPKLRLIFRQEEIHIHVKISTEGFLATLRPHGGKKPIEACWQTDTGRWYPDKSYRKLLRAAHDHPVEFQVSKEIVLSQSVRLPEAALLNLPDAIAYGLPMWSPFSADELYLTHSVQQINAGQAIIKLLYIRRIKIDPLLESLKMSGFIVDRLTFDVMPSKPVLLFSPKLRRTQLSRWIDRGLTLSAFCLAFALGILTSIVLSRQVDIVENALRLELEQLRQEETLRNAYKTWRVRCLVVSMKKDKEVAVSELLSYLAQVLPSNMALLSFEVDNGRARADILGDHSVDLLQTFASVPVIQNVTIEPTGVMGVKSATFQIVGKSR